MLWNSEYFVHVCDLFHILLSHDKFMGPWNEWMNEWMNVYIQISKNIHYFALPVSVCGDAEKKFVSRDQAILTQKRIVLWPRLQHLGRKIWAEREGGRAREEDRDITSSLQIIPTPYRNPTLHLLVYSPHFHYFSRMPVNV